MKQVLLRHAARQGAASLLPAAAAAARQQQQAACSSAVAPLPALQQQRRGAVHACGAAPPLPRRRVVTLAGLPFSLAPSRRPLKFSWGRRFPSYSAEEMQVEVDALLEGSPGGVSAQQLRELLAALQQDCGAAVPHALVAKQAAQPRYRLPAIANVSLVLCDDAYIRQLNRQYRGTDAATDVLSFELPDDEDGPPLPVKLLGDLVISVDTAARQAAERGHSLQAELRVLLVHGLLHLAGFDHEKGQQQHDEMAGHEAALMATLGWEGSGLISAAEAAAAAAAAAAVQDDSSSQGEEDRFSPDGSSSSSSSSGLGGGGSVAASSVSSSSSVLAEPPSRASKRPRRSPQVKLVALDMDGTLLDGSSRIAPASAAAIRAATDAGVRVILATGKARPAAIAACRQAGLAGDGLLVSRRTPGIFLQGLAVHGHQGRQLSDASLPTDVVAQAFTWAGDAGVSCVAFLGDECATLRLTDDLRALHTTYYEPLAQEAASLDALLAGPAVRKLLFMAPPDLVEGLLKPHWGAALAGGGAELLQAVPNMLEVVPAGVNKWAGLQVLLTHLDVQREQFMAVGDGSNDLQMVANAGVGVAMGNAVPAVKAAAAAVVASNDDGGIVEAFERYVL